VDGIGTIAVPPYVLDTLGRELQRVGKRIRYYRGTGMDIAKLLSGLEEFKAVLESIKEIFDDEQTY